MPLNPLKIATQFNLINSTTQTLSLPRNVACSRVPHKIGGGDVTHLALAFESCILPSNSTGNLNALGNGYTVDSVVVEYNGVAAQLMFDGGSATKNVPNNVTNVLTDELSVQTAFGVASIPYNAQIWVKLKISCAAIAGQKLPIAQRNSESSTPQFLTYDPAQNNLSNPLATGAWTAPGATFNDYGYTPIVLGRHTTATAVAVVAHGDSITAGATDTGFVAGGYGWLGRIFSAMTTAPAFLNLAVGGSTLLAGNADAKLLPYYVYANVGMSNGATNDFSTNGTSQSVATVLSRQATIRGRMKNQGIRKVGVMCTLSITTSTDSWVTEVNQTTNAGWGAGGFPETYNTTIKAGGYDFVVPHDAIRATSSVYKFKVAAQKTTDDGIHPNAYGYGLLRAESQSLIETSIAAALTPVAYTSAGSGDWNNTAMWSPAGVPTELDPVTIIPGHTITVPAGYIARHNGLTLNGTAGNLSTVVITGKLECHGDITKNADGVITGVVTLNGYSLNVDGEVPPTGLRSGDGVLLSAALFGINAYDVSLGEIPEYAFCGVFRLPKAAVTNAQFAAAYWDNTNKVTTTSASGNVLIGIYTEASGSSVPTPVKLIPKAA